VADFVDLKSPYMLGHARATAGLVDAAGRRLDLREDERMLLRRAGLAHGLGRLGVSNAIWDKPGPLGPAERERVLLQPYYTERMLRQSPALAPIGAVAGQLRERVDGSGSPRGLTGDAIGVPARLLGAADAYRAMLEPRPHRAALPPEQAAAELRGEARAGRLDGDAVEAVLVAAGERRAARPARPCGLTEREVEVLRLLSRGLSSRQIATELVISPKTARNHIEHIYAKTGATTRVTASLFALRHGLVGDTAGRGR
jgi:HD-GYP domain-containing protein (c-di-GMP phosphodiesterase class II)